MAADTGRLLQCLGVRALPIAAEAVKAAMSKA